MNFRDSDISVSPNKVSQEQETTQFQPKYDTIKQKEGIKFDLAEPSRFLNSNFNPEISFRLLQACTAQEKRVLEDWLKVTFADSKVLLTLVQIQGQLKTVLIPYRA
ncbi:hypothetical protein EPUL_006325 [Erysiphe pulchra]|uniref:Uncharacterized protein n=1 Tax=Erysiphe pulchra TaxID=225359 RepID=A0A2S4PK03_9PEZI|nr:hypothetical protein EPUL_006325 [Erysiphe pulchra]